MSLRGHAAIVGIGELAPVPYTEGASNLGMLAEVGIAAIEDSGIPFGEIDGLLVHPIGGAALVPATLAEFMGLRLAFAESVDLGGASAAGMVWRAAGAIAGGLCTSCLCVTATRRERRPERPRRSEPASRSKPGRAGRRSSRSPAEEFEPPYGLTDANSGYALIAARYQYEYGVLPEQLAKIAVDQRANACANREALFFGKPITIDDVLGSEMIADPLHLLDIVRPCAGGAAVVVTAADRARDLPHPPAYLLGAGEACTHTGITYAPSITNTAIKPAADTAFAMAGVARGDIGLASLYDCYTITVLLTLEDAGFCAKGEGGAFVEDHDLRWFGDFPVNTHGGQLSFGQPGLAGGMSHVTEAARQIQRRVAERQVKDLDFAYVSGNGGIMSEQVSLILGAAA